MNRIHLVPPLLLLLGGCSTIADSFKSPGIPSNPWVGRTACEAGGCTRQNALDAVARSQNYCSELREYQERGGQITGGQRLFVGVLGSLAGTVFAVTAGGTAAKAWSGLSGATNGIQMQMDQANRPSGPAVVEAIAKAQLDAAAELKQLMAVAVQTQLWEPVVLAAVLLPNSCSAAAGMGFVKQQDAQASANGRAAEAKAATQDLIDAAKAAPSAPAR